MPHPIGQGCCSIGQQFQIGAQSGLNHPDTRIESVSGLKFPDS